MYYKKDYRIGPVFVAHLPLNLPHTLKRYDEEFAAPHWSHTTCSYQLLAWVFERLTVIPSFSLNVTCEVCGHRSRTACEVDSGTLNYDRLFVYIGKTPKNYWRVQCPSCHAELGVDPRRRSDQRFRTGNVLHFPGRILTHKRRSPRYVPIASGIIYTGLALFFILKIGTWWTYIIGGLLFMLAWGSIKTGLFASDQEIDELTDPDRPVSQETKEKFIDRMSYDSLQIELTSKSENIEEGIRRREEILRWLQILKEDEREVIRLRFGLDNGEPQSIEQIGKIMGLTPEKVQQIEYLALSRLQQIRTSKTT